MGSPASRSSALRRNVDRARRAIEERLDQAWALGRKRLVRPPSTPPFDGTPRLALVTVNYSTTRLLQLMLLTLTEQRALGSLRRIVIVDNGSRDGGPAFARALATRVPRVSVALNRVILSHGRGMRCGLRHLDRLEAEDGVPASERANVLLFVDTDVIFRDPDTLGALGRLFAESGAAAAGELRRGLYPYPEAQASFLAVRRDAYARPDVDPWVDHGAPAYYLQRSLWRAGLRVEHFPSNRGGYVLHRGRAGVAAAADHHPLRSSASIAGTEPHFMGIPGGAEIWARAEARAAELLADEGRLLDRLARDLG